MILGHHSGVQDGHQKCHTPNQKIEQILTNNWFVGLSAHLLLAPIHIATIML
jgi:hypothetical protein